MADFMTRPELAELFVDLFLLAASIVDISAARRVPWTTTRGKANVFFCLESVITWLFELLQSPPCEQARFLLGIREAKIAVDHGWQQLAGRRCERVAS